MNPRRSTAALAVSAALLAAAAPVAHAASSSATAPTSATAQKGLYGSKNAQFDGVWRQSLALIAQESVGYTPATSAVDWLAGQQCADGGFASFRADPGKPCDQKKGEFSDATGAAVQALAAVGGRAHAVRRGIAWLTEHQNADGGWGVNPGDPSDANDTATAIGALAAVGKDPVRTTSTKGNNPYHALLALQAGCTAEKQDRGGFAYLPYHGTLAPNTMATTAAALAAEGRGFRAVRPSGHPASRGSGGAHGSPTPLDCTKKGRTSKATGVATAVSAADAAGAADAYLSTTMAAHGEHLVTPKSTPDFSDTAGAVTALAAAGYQDAAAKPLRWLESASSGTRTWAKGDPGALATLVLAAHAAGVDPHHFGGTDLVRQLNATGPKPARGPQESTASHQDGGVNPAVWWVIGVGLVAGIGLGLLLSIRKRQRLS